MNRRILDFLAGSVAYVYGSGMAVSVDGRGVPSDQLARHLLDYLQRSYYHSFSGRLNASFGRTRTNITAVIQWYPGASLTPIDLFADHSDSLTKGGNFFIRQPLPLPEFMGGVGRWEALEGIASRAESQRRRSTTAVLLERGRKCVCVQSPHFGNTDRTRSRSPPSAESPGGRRSPCGIRSNTPGPSGRG